MTNLTYSGWFAHISGYPSAEVERRTGKFAGEKADVIPLFHGTNQSQVASDDRLLSHVTLAASNAGSKQLAHR